MYTKADFTPPDRTVEVVSYRGHTPQTLAAKLALTGATYVELTSSGAVFRSWPSRNEQGVLAAIPEIRRLAPQARLLASWRPNECRAWMLDDWFQADLRDWLIRHADGRLEAALRPWTDGGWTWGAAPGHWPGTTQGDRDMLMFSWCFVRTKRRWSVACPEFQFHPVTKRMEVTSLRLDLRIEEARRKAVEHALYVLGYGLDGLIVTHNAGTDSLDLSYQTPDGYVEQTGQWQRIGLGADGGLVRIFHDPAKPWGPEGSMAVTAGSIHSPIHAVAPDPASYETGMNALVREVHSGAPDALLVTNSPTDWRGGAWWRWDEDVKASLVGDAVWR